MDWQGIADLIFSQGIWCALFCWLFFTNKKEAREREQELQGVIKEQGEQLKEVSNTLEGINTNMEKMNLRVEQIEEKLK